LLELSLAGQGSPKPGGHQQSFARNLDLGDKNGRRSFGNHRRQCDEDARNVKWFVSCRVSVRLQKRIDLAGDAAQIMVQSELIQLLVWFLEPDPGAMDAHLSLTKRLKKFWVCVQQQLFSLGHISNQERLSRYEIPQFDERRQLRDWNRDLVTDIAWMRSELVYPVGDEPAPEVSR
jgi:hypothetical protein